MFQMVYCYDNCLQLRNCIFRVLCRKSAYIFHSGIEGGLYKDLGVAIRDDLSQSILELNPKMNLPIMHPTADWMHELY